MHWLAQQLERVVALADEGTDPALGLDRRKQFLDAVTRVVEELGTRPGLERVFASYEGLLVAKAPASADTATFEAIAALSQACLEPASDSAAQMELGELEQLVLVGGDRKLALIRVGPLALGLVSRREVQLAEVTGA